MLSRIKKAVKPQQNTEAQEAPTLTQEVTQEAKPLHQEEKQPSLEGLDTSSQATNEPSHFDDLITSAEKVEAEQEFNEVSSSMVTLEQFQQSFTGLHGLASSLSGIKAIALPNSGVSQEVADQTAIALYETIMDIPMLHFMLQPGNKWLGRSFVMLAYVQGMRIAIREELGAKQKKTQQTKPQAQQPPKGDISPDQAAALTGA